MIKMRRIAPPLPGCSGADAIIAYRHRAIAGKLVNDIATPYREPAQSAQEALKGMITDRAWSERQRAALADLLPGDGHNRAETLGLPPAHMAYAIGRR
jgi:hypothetical protein